MIFNQEELIEIYNHIPHILRTKIITVTIPKEFFLQGNSEDKNIVLKRSNNGDYWIFPLDQDQGLLFPKPNRKINQHEYKTVQKLFDCQGYEDSETKTFTVKKFTQVALDATRKEYQLQSKGVLDFIPTSPLSQLKLDLSVTKAKNKRLQLKLTESKQKLKQVQSKLAQLQERHQLLLSVLEINKNLSLKAFEFLENRDKFLDKFQSLFEKQTTITNSNSDLFNSNLSDLNQRLEQIEVSLKIKEKERSHLEESLTIEPIKIPEFQPEKQNLKQERKQLSQELNSWKNKLLIWDKLEWIINESILLPELKFLDLEDRLPGGLLPKIKGYLTFNGEKITPLMPLNPILLNYFTPEDLVKNIELESFNNGNDQGIRLTFNFPLLGMDEKKPFHIYRLQKEYLLKEENRIKYLPVLTVWPNFRAKGWKEYYTFYDDGDLGDDTFRVDFAPEKPKTFKESNGEGFSQLSNFDEIPAYLICRDTKNQNIGLILLATLPEINPEDTWRVGVDFDTSFTNIYVKSGNSDELPLDINQDLQLNITESPIATRYPALFESFIPPQFLPVNEPLPLCTVLTTKNGNTETDELLPIFDGRIYIPDPTDYDPNKKWIESDLKWPEDLKYIRLFLENLALIISATATKKGIRNIQYSISYPNHLPYREKCQLVDMWRAILQKLAVKTGMSLQCPEIDDQTNFCSQNMALGYYWKYSEKQYLVKSTTINIQKDKSDICIWEGNKIIYQCSVLLGSRDIFSGFLTMNPQFTEKLIGQSWSSMSETYLTTKIDVWLRDNAENWLKKDRIYKNDDEYFQGFITLIALGVAGLYYYIGLILKVLYEEGKYSKPEITPVYIASHESSLLHWLSETGKYDQNTDFNKLLSLMLSKASGFEYSPEKTKLSKKPKHEIASGLVLNDGKLMDFAEETDFMIAGESYYVEYKNNDQEFTEKKDWKSDLHLQGNINNFEITDLTNLERFLSQFQEGIQSLNIHSVQPLAKSDYQLQKTQHNTLKIEMENNFSYKQKQDQNSQLWREVRSDLDDKLLNIKGNADDIREKTPFIMGLKSLIFVLGRRWAEST